MKVKLGYLHQPRCLRGASPQYTVTRRWKSTKVRIEACDSVSVQSHPSQLDENHYWISVILVVGKRAEKRTEKCFTSCVTRVLVPLSGVVIITVIAVLN